MKIVLLLFSALAIGSCKPTINNKASSTENTISISATDRHDTINDNKTPFVIKLFRAKNREQSIGFLDSLLTCKKIIHKYKSDDDTYETRINLYIDTVKNAMRAESTESMNSSVIVNEYRALKIDNNVKLIYSVFAGTRAFTNQSEFYVYDYKNENLVVDTNSTSLFDLKRSDFLVESIPDSIQKELPNESFYFFHIVYNDKGIAECWYSSSFIEEKYKKWFKGNTICFSINNNKIERSKPYFRE